MSYNKYTYLNINEEKLLDGLKEIENLCNIISNNSFLSCNDCPLEYWCDTGLLSFVIMDSEEKDRIVNALKNIDLIIKNDKMTF